MATGDRIIPLDPAQEAARAQALAERYYHEYVDLKEVRIDHELFTSIPVDLMFRYNFVPIQGHNGTLEIALADPRNLNMIDELSVLLSKKLRVKVATLSQIADLLKKTEQSQRVLEEVTEGFTLDVVISDGLWKRAFGSDPHIVGRSLRGDNDLFRVIGVMPPGFRDPGRTVGERNTEQWAALGFEDPVFNQ